VELIEHPRTFHEEGLRDRREVSPGGHCAAYVDERDTAGPGNRSHDHGLEGALSQAPSQQPNDEPSFLCGQLSDQVQEEVCAQTRRPGAGNLACFLHDHVELQERHNASVRRSRQLGPR
jgi:hypothetical protein